MADLALVSYIKRHLQKGYTKEELLNILTKNGWSKSEINNAFKAIESGKKVILPQQTKKISRSNNVQKTNLPSEQEKLQAHLTILKDFISKSRLKGISDDEIKKALVLKGWPKDLIERGFGLVSQPKQQEVMPKQEKTQQPKIKKPINWKSILWYIIAFFVITAIIAGTIFVYHYVAGLSQYTINLNGVEYHGKCLNSGCSDMKEFALNYANERLSNAILIGAIAALIIVGLYAVAQIRNVILWAVNILYFIFLVFIGVKWVLFTKSIS